MGAQLSKGGVEVEGKAAADPAAAKANGQENGHVKTNGDVSDKPDGEVVAADGNGTAEPAKEGEANAGDAIEPAPVAEGEASKAEAEAGKDGKKKKKFSLKNSFKFKGISLKKNKKGSEEGKEEATSPTTEDKPEENGHTAKETKEETPAVEAKEGEAVASPAAEGEVKAAEEAPPTEDAPAEEAAAAAAAESTTPAASEGEAKAE
ncbi:PREDICTED: MARCKS-related protein [Cyprinodon variegatus]|uniref:MARCKS-like 1a n=1 Tax=Cyprinodon variegatus TaxID=28743 RepID=A0A3Q2CL88_CYPVA|nr:PREDICTED: MARCKS-related protein [Cyprinodon variegatus]